MLIKIQNGTKDSSQSSLCLSCANGSVVKGDRESDLFVSCGSITFSRDHDVVPFRKVTECTAYRNKNLPSLRDMQEIAWVLVTDRNRTKIGFKQSKEWIEDQKKDGIKYPEVLPDID